MKIYYQSADIVLLPRKSTIDFLMQFSKSIDVIKTKNLEFFLAKN